MWSVILYSCNKFWKKGLFTPLFTVVDLHNGFFKIPALHFSSTDFTIFDMLYVNKWAYWSTEL